MFRAKDTIDIQLPRLTEEETDIIKQLGFCGSTKKLLQVFCFDCKTLVSIETFIQDHSNHSVIENDAKNAKNIFKVLKPTIDQKYENRVKNLQEKIKTLVNNLKDLQVKKSAARLMIKTDSKIQEGSEKLVKNFKKVESWIERYEKESIEVLNVLKERVSQAEKQFEEFNESIERCSHLNPIINNYNLTDFSHFLDSRISNDQNYRIHEVPKASAYSKKVYFHAFYEITSVILESLMQTFEVYDEELDFLEVENFFIEGIKKVFREKDLIVDKGELKAELELVRVGDVSCFEEKKVEEGVERTRKPEDTQEGARIAMIESKNFSENNSFINESNKGQKNNRYRNHENFNKNKKYDEFSQGNIKK